MWGLSPVAANRGHSSSWCAGLSLSRPLLLQSTGSRCAGSVIVAHGPSCSAACGIFPDQGSNRCPLRRQADSQPLRRQGSPLIFIYHTFFLYSSFNGLLGFFHLLSIVNNDAMNIGLQVPVFCCFGTIPRSGIAGSCGNLYLTFFWSFIPFIYFLYWGIVDIQYYISFRCTT